MKKIIILFPFFLVLFIFCCTTQPAPEVTVQNTINLPTGDKIWHEVSNSGEPAFQNSWVNYDATTYSTCAFRIDEQGFVYLKGTVKSGAINTTIFTIPAGYRPSKILMIVVYGGAINSMIAVSPNGNVACGPNFNTFINLDGVTYFGDQ
jgi:hypothetical protein